ncbi:hypothetical protein HYFRA_00001322 [Hymenoscyphus fraxineus]|uniref:Uncharacterized protein n=1 Tax=Hymenoscyphus fraxineus TaxID=746836 RepID=A0A9N9L5F5_9HELO|nr:hypothetical protein HYFRA_00001322 [Hymenoscyphus fraxineus]
MPSINEQPTQITEQMSLETPTVETAQPTAVPGMTSEVSMRGGEEAGCDCCCCGCEESCC